MGGDSMSLTAKCDMFLKSPRVDQTEKVENIGKVGNLGKGGEGGPNSSK